MTERDAKDLVDWLDQAEEETKATIAEHERIDPFYDGVLSTVQTVREYIKKIGLKVWYRELSVYDTTRAKLSADSVEVTMKLAIPRFKGVDSKCVCIIDGEQHEVYNVAHTTTKDGFRESELTLKTPAYEREVIDDTERTE